MWFSLVLLLFTPPQDPLIFPGNATPTHCLTPTSQAWWIRQDDGALPQLWYHQEKKAYTPDPAVLFVAGDGSDGLVAVTETGLARLSLNAGSLKAEAPLVSFDEPLTENHPWLPTPTFTVQGQPWLVIANGRRIAAIPIAANGQAAFFSVPALAADADPAQHSFLQPVFIQAADLLYAVFPSGVFTLTFAAAQPPRAGFIALPETESLEQVVPIWLPGQAQPHWLYYGGEFGDLNKFGWRITDHSGKSQAEGDGILVKHALESDAKLPRLLVFTVSNKLSTHAFSRISGNTTFHCDTLVFRAGTWSVSQSFTFKVAKDDDKPRRPVALQWQRDKNGDGFNELLVSDARRGARLYVSKADGTFGDKPEDRDLAAFHRAIPVGDHLWLAWREDGLWRLQDHQP